MRRFLLWGGGVILALCAAVFVTGMMLPREHRARSCISLEQPADSVWTVMRDIGGTGSWWPMMTAAERVDSAGAERWRETVDGFEMTVRVEETEPGVEFHTLIESPPGSFFGGRWVYRIEPSPVGHTVCVTEEGWISNPGLRAMANLMGLHGSLDSYLTALAARFAVSYVPEHLD